MAINGRGRPTKKQVEEASRVELYLRDIAAYNKDFERWQQRSKKILERYRDDARSKGADTQARFNILWSNVQTLIPATFSKLPQPDVSRRFRDTDPVGRVAGMILERALDFEIQHYSDYRQSMRQSVHDRFLGGRGTCWVRYEPHIRSVKSQLPEDGLQVTEDAEVEEIEELDYECAPVDYVHWRDFGHSIARTWEEVTKVWRKVYLTRAACIERFGDELGKKVPLDSKPADKDKSQMGQNEEQASRALIFEIWDKETDSAVWLSKSMGQILDERDDPLGLQEFFPCPRPLYATLTNDSLVPIPDYTLYQDQAKELDMLSDRIDGLIQSLQVRGVYNAEFTELSRLFTEGQNGSMIPITNFAAFAEKQGLKGAIDLVDLVPIAQALEQAYKAMDQVKQQIYDITGLADIVRGQSNANETATAQNIKGQYASLRLNAMKGDVAMYATEILRLKAQVMCAKFAPETLVKISAAEQLSQEDQQLIPQALALLVGEDRMMNPDAEEGPNPLRSFRIEIAADSMVEADEQKEKEQRTEFIKVVGGYLKEAAPVVSSLPQIAPLVMEMLKFATVSFKAGKQMEGLIDETADQLKQMAQQAMQNPKPDPEMMKVQAAQQTEQAKLQAQGQLEQMRQQHEAAIEQGKIQAQAAIEQQKIQWEAQAKEREQQMTAASEAQRNQLEAQRENLKMQQEASLRELEYRHSEAIEAAKLDFERWKAELQARTQLEVAEMSAQTTIAAAQASAAKQASEGKPVSEPKQPDHGPVIAKALDGMSAAISSMNRPKKLIKGPDGKTVGIE